MFTLIALSFLNSLTSLSRYVLNYVIELALASFAFSILIIAIHCKSFILVHLFPVYSLWTFLCSLFIIKVLLNFIRSIPSLDLHF